MRFFDEMTAAVETYPLNYVVLEIVDVNIPGNALNEGEQATFRVKVTNNGPLNLTGVTVHVRGQNGATVANNGAAAPFVLDFFTQELPTISAHGGSQLSVGSPLKFKAPAGAQASAVLVNINIERWNCNLQHILDDHSDPLDAAKGTYSAEVVAS